MTDLERIEQKLDLIIALLQKKKRKPYKTRLAATGLPGFETWWGLYPRKVGKAAAELKWRSLKCEDNAEQMIDDMHERQIAWEKTEIIFIPHPATFLYQKRWLDPIEHAIPTKKELPPRLNEDLAAWGAERGVDPNVGESMADYRRRLERLT